jgi:hypothetical protein
MNELLMIAATIGSGILAGCRGRLEDTDYEKVRQIAIREARRYIAETKEAEKREQGN